MLVNILSCAVLVQLMIGLPGGPRASAQAQPLEKVLFNATNSEDMNQVLFRYGVEKGHFKKERLDLEYRYLPPNLALAALISKDIDYVSQLGTVSQAAR